MRNFVHDFQVWIVAASIVTLPSRAPFTYQAVAGWIAASAMEHSAEPVTLDRDFTHVPQILFALYEQ